MVTAVLVDLAMYLQERPELDTPTALVGRRLDDLAYGLGLWVGAVRSRSARCLAPRRA